MSGDGVVDDLGNVDPLDVVTVHCTKSPLNADDDVNQNNCRPSDSSQRCHDVQCVVCAQSFADPSLLASHLANAHSSEIICTECNKLFKTSAGLHAHKYSHVSHSSPAELPFCHLKRNHVKMNRQLNSARRNLEKSFSLSLELSDEEKKETKTKAIRNTPKRQAAIEEESDELYVHKYQHVSHPCPKCPAEFPSPILKRRHVRLNHQLKSDGKNLPSCTSLSLESSNGHAEMESGTDNSSGSSSSKSTSKHSTSSSAECSSGSRRVHQSTSHDKQQYQSLKKLGDSNTKFSFPFCPPFYVVCDECGEEFNCSVDLDNHKLRLHSAHVLLSTIDHLLPPT